MLKQKNNSILVSVIMPVYNNESYVGEAIESILKQTHSNFEFIIIDDCSTDNSWKIIQKYSKKDKRIKAFQNEKNLKIVKTRNKGFRECNSKAKYFAIMDSDDISLVNRFEEEIKFLEENKDFALVGSHNIIINEKNKEIGFRKYPVSWNEVKKTMTRFDPIAQPVAMIRAEVLRKEIGFYNEKFTRCQDYELWCRIGSKHKIGNIDKALLRYRVSNTQGKRTHLKDTIRFTLEIQRKWLFHKRYFNCKNVIIHILSYISLILPQRTILWLFEKTRYKKK